MADDTSAESGATSNTESGEETNTEQTVRADGRSADEYAQKLVEVSAENKKFRQKASKLAEERDALQKQIEGLREQQLKEQGQYKQMYEEMKSKYDAQDSQLKKDRAAFAYKTVTSQFAAEAAKAGCTKVDDLIKLATADGIISELEVSQEDYSVTPDSLKAGLERAQKQYSYLYGKPTPVVRDGVPTSNKKQSATGPDLAKMKVEELVALAKTLPN